MPCSRHRAYDSNCVACYDLECGSKPYFGITLGEMAWLDMDEEDMTPAQITARDEWMQDHGIFNPRRGY